MVFEIVVVTNSFILLRGLRKRITCVQLGHLFREVDMNLGTVVSLKTHIGVLDKDTGGGYLILVLFGLGHDLSHGSDGYLAAKGYVLDVVLARLGDPLLDLRAFEEDFEWTPYGRGCYLVGVSSLDKVDEVLRLANGDLSGGCALYCAEL